MAFFSQALAHSEQRFGVFPFSWVVVGSINEVDSNDNWAKQDQRSALAREVSCLLLSSSELLASDCLPDFPSIASDGSSIVPSQLLPLNSWQRSRNVPT